MTDRVQVEYDGIASNYDTRWSSYLNSTREVALKLINPISGDMILDVSGGTGLLAEKIAQNVSSAKIILIDISTRILTLASKKLVKYSNAVVLRMDAHKLKFKDNSFTKISSISALHHYANPEEFLQECFRVLVPGGKLVIIDWCRDTIDSIPFDFFMGKFNKSHNKTYTTSELKQMLTDHGFAVSYSTRWRSGMWSLMAFEAIRR